MIFSTVENKKLKNDMLYYLLKSIHLLCFATPVPTALPMPMPSTSTRTTPTTAISRNLLYSNFVPPASFAKPVPIMAVRATVARTIPTIVVPDRLLDVDKCLNFVLPASFAIIAHLINIMLSMPTLTPILLLT